MAEATVTATHSPNGAPMHKIDLNTADPEELIALSGVGPVLAQRIVAARPFATVEELERVPGIGPAFLERLRPFLTTGEAEGTPETISADEQVDETPAEPVGVEIETAAEEAAGEDDLGEAPAEAPEAEVPEPEAETKHLPAPMHAPVELPRNLITRGQAFWLALGLSLLAFVLALAVSLGVLMNLNGGLRFATPAQMLEVSREVDALQSETELLQGDLEGLRSRIGNLEALGGRVDAVEAETEQLKANLADTEARVAAVQQQSDEIAQDVAGLKDQSAKVQTFLGSLRDLLNELFVPAEAP